MTGAEVLYATRQMGATVERYGERLRCDLPPGPLHRLLLRLIGEYQAEILELLTDRGCHFSDQDEIHWRFGRLRRRVLAEGLPPDLLVRPGLLRVPERCCSCSELFGSGPEGRHCPPCEDAAAIVRQLHVEGRLAHAPVPASAAAQAENARARTPWMQPLGSPLPPAADALPRHSRDGADQAAGLDAELADALIGDWSAAAGLRGPAPARPLALEGAA